MRAITSSASRVVQSLTDAVDQADVDALVECLSRGIGAPVALLDTAGRRIAVAGGQGRLGGLLCLEGDRAVSDAVRRCLDADTGNPASVPFGSAAVLLAAFLVDAEEHVAALIAGPVLTVEPDEVASSQDRLRELAAELGTDASVARERVPAEVAWDEARLADARANLSTAAHALSLLCRCGRALRRKDAELEAVYEVGIALMSSLDLNRVLEQILGRAIQQARARAGSVMLLDESRQYLTIARARGLSDEIVATARVPMGEGISGWVAQENKPRVMLKGVRDLLSRSRRPSEQMTSALSAPIRAGEHVIGVINVNDCQHAENFDEQDLRILQMLSVAAGVALENARVHATLQSESK